MQLRFAEKTLSILLLAILAGIVLHAPFTVFFGTIAPEFSLVIKAWKELLMLVAAGFAGVVVYQRTMWSQLAHDKLLWLLAGYSALHGIVLLLFWNGWQATLAGLAIDLRFIGYFVLVYILLLAAPQVRSLFVKTAIAGAIVVVGFGVLQLFLPPDVLKHIGYDKDRTIAPYLTVDQNADYVRINSTLRGPNPLGAYVVIVLSGLTAVVTRRRVNIRTTRTLLLIVGSMAAATVVLWASYSRSALGAALIAVALVGILAYGKLIHRYVWITIGFVVLSLIGGVYTARDTDFVSHVILHEDPSEGNEVNSNDGHVSSLIHGTQRMIAQPLGAGIGSTGSASLFTDTPMIIENHYLFIAHEIGWVGVLLFLSLYGLVLWRLWRQRSNWLSLTLFSSGVGLAAIGMLLPVWADDTVSIIWWGLAAVALATARSAEKKQ